MPRRRRSAWITVALAMVSVAAPPAARAAAIDSWTDRTGVVARFGDRLVSTYDLMLAIAMRRMLAGEALEPAPAPDEWRTALAATFNQTVLLDAADRAQAGFPDIERMRLEARGLLERYGQGDTYGFWRRTGIPFVRVEEEVRRRAVVERYVTEVLGDQSRVADDEVAAYYAAHATEWAGGPLGRMAPQIRRLIAAERMRGELERLRERFLERVEVELLDPSYRLEDLKRVGSRPDERLPR